MSLKKEEKDSYSEKFFNRIISLDKLLDDKIDKLLLRVVNISKYAFIAIMIMYLTPVGGWPIGSIGDYFGLPTVGQVSPGKRVTHSALPFRAYNLIFNEWFRDENLVPSVNVDTGDGPDVNSTYVLLSRGKRHDYFTSCLPWP